MKCQRCVVGFNLGFCDGRGRYARIAVDFSIRHHVQVSLRSLFCWTPSFLSTLGSNDLRGSLHLYGLTHRAFLGLGSLPQTGSISSSRLFHGHSKVQPPGICLHPVVVLWRRRALFTRRTHKIPNGGGTDASGRFLEQELAHGMHTGPFTEWGDCHLIDPRLLPVHYRMVDVSARFRDRWVASGMPIASAVSERDTSCTLCLRKTGGPMPSTTLLPCCHSPTPRRCGFAHAITSSSLDHFRPYRHHQI